MDHPKEEPLSEAIDQAEQRGEEIILNPEWEPTALWFATALKDHSFDRGAAAPIISFIEQIRWLTLTDKPAVERILNHFRRIPDSPPVMDYSIDQEIEARYSEPGIFEMEVDRG